SAGTTARCGESVTQGRKWSDAARTATRGARRPGPQDEPTPDGRLQAGVTAGAVGVSTLIVWGATPWAADHSRRARSALPFSAARAASPNSTTAPRVSLRVTVPSGRSV